MCASLFIFPPFHFSQFNRDFAEKLNFLHSTQTNFKWTCWFTNLAFKWAMHSNVFHHNSVPPCRIWSFVLLCVWLSTRPRPRPRPMRPPLPKLSCSCKFSCICSRKLNPIRVAAVYAVWVLVWLLFVFIFISASSSQLCIYSMGIVFE